MNARILIVDDEDSIREHLRRYFSRRSVDVLTASSGGVAVAICTQHMVDVVILDLRLPDMDGLDVLAQVKAASPQTGVIMITAHGDVDTAVKAMLMKADNFLLKPVDLKALEALVNKVIEGARARSEILYLKEKVSRLSGFPGPVRLRFPPKVMATIDASAASASASVLIQGETGTGKGMAARLIHELSPRSSGDFVDLNCATLTTEFLESEVFGHEKGAFTDAKAFKRGMLELAHGGTLFLDEIGELDMPVQAKLLKVIEEKTFRRLGGTANIHVDARIIAATNMDLERSVQGGTFRRDLFYRLNVMPLRIPPLRERREDVLPLAKDFREELSHTSPHRQNSGFTPDAVAFLENYHWPGNIRELRNVIERAVLICEGDLIGAEHLPEALTVRKSRGGFPAEGDLTLEATERVHIAKVLELCEGNRSKAAKLLGIHRSTLLEKIDRYGLPR